MAGRNFDEAMETDWENSYILNEAAVRELGWDDPVNQPFRAWDRPMGRVIGVVKDFHYQSLHQEIVPVVINMKPWFGTVAVRLAPERLREGLEHLEGRWRAFAPAHAFDYTFLDDDFGRLYRAEEQLMQRFTFFAVIALLIARLTVGYQSLRAATANPVKSLRYE